MSRRDLCDVCEGVAIGGDASGHTADHIMMKVSFPSHQCSAVLSNIPSP